MVGIILYWNFTLCKSIKKSLINWPFIKVLISSTEMIVKLVSLNQPIKKANSVKVDNSIHIIVVLLIAYLMIYISGNKTIHNKSTICQYKAPVSSPI